MLKRIKRMSACTFAFVMMFSMTAFAAENDSEGGTEVSPGNAAYSQEGPSVKETVTAVSKVEIAGASIDSGGNVIVRVYIVGYGHNEVAKWDGVRAKLINEDLITGTDNTVFAFQQYWNCGPAAAGTHTFTFSTASIISPHNTVSASAEITIP